MKKFKNKIAVTGSVALRKAFRDELFNLGYEWRAVDKEDFDRESHLYNYWNCAFGLGNGSKSHIRMETITLSLPQDWNKAIQLASEVEEEIPEWATIVEDELKVGDYIYFIKAFDSQKVGNIGKILELGKDSYNGKYWLSYESLNKNYIGGFRVDGNGYNENIHFRKATSEEIAKSKEDTIEIAGYKAEVKDNKIAFGCKKFSREDLLAIAEVLEIAERTDLDFTFCPDSMVSIGYDGENYPIHVDNIRRLTNKL